jgi:hypothetical protein
MRIVPQREAARFCGRSPTGTDFITLRVPSPGPVLFALRFRNIGTIGPSPQIPRRETGAGCRSFNGFFTVNRESCAVGSEPGSALMIRWQLGFPGRRDPGCRAPFRERL